MTTYTKEAGKEFVIQYLQKNMKTFVRMLMAKMPGLKVDALIPTALAVGSPLIAALAKTHFDKDIDEDTLKGSIVEVLTDLQPRFVEEFEAVGKEPVTDTSPTRGPRKVLIEDGKGDVFHHLECPVLKRTKEIEEIVGGGGGDKSKGGKGGGGGKPIKRNVQREEIGEIHRRNYDQVFLVSLAADCCATIFEDENAKAEKAKKKDAPSAVSHSYTHFLGKIVADKKDADLALKALHILNVVLPTLDRLTELPVVMEINDHGEAVGSLFCKTKADLVAYALASKEKKVRTGAASLLGVPGEVLEYTGRRAAVVHRTLKATATTAATAAKDRRVVLEAKIQDRKDRAAAITVVVPPKKKVGLWDWLMGK